MMINFNPQTSTFTIETQNSSYIITISQKGYVAHTYYGTKTGSDDVTYLLRQNEYPFSDSEVFREKLCLLDFLPQEYPMEGIGDFRPAALAVKNSHNHNAVELKYKSYSIIDGTVELPDMPHVFVSEADKTSKAQTLAIATSDEVLGLEVTLYYTVFSDTDAIIRFAKISYTSPKKDTPALFITRALSASFDLDNDNYDMITLNGSWARERHIDRHPIHKGMQSVSSNRGVSTHQEHPFLAVLAHHADYDNGDVYGMNFIYSGNFIASVHNNQFDSLRIQIGLNPENFCWKLSSTENPVFYTPQAVLVFSQQGLNGMTHAFHDLYRNHLIRSPFKNKMRPILINNWEATYFDFDTEKLLKIASEAAKDGIEMLVMDDGWFGHRTSDNSSLGDWYVNEDKLKGNLKNLVDKVNKLGLKFGIWFEPEMVSPDSALYRAHPDWAINIPGREPGLSRQQLILDITRTEVQQYIFDSIAKILHSANIEYVKWDMNRQLTDTASSTLPDDRTGEYFHRYTLAVYALQERLLKEFPNLLLENCSSGGARFDPGMFYYSPQIWCSDDTDAFERLAIQEGTVLVYPLSTMGSHVSVCPNHACGRTTPFKTRGYVALAGTFGYELDITKLSDEERRLIPSQIALYKNFSSLIREGDYNRIASFSENGEFDSWICVSKDKTKALMTFVQIFNHPNYKTRMIKLKALDDNKIYQISYPDEDQNKFKPLTLSGLTIKNAGLPVARDWGDFQAKLIYIEETK